MNQRMVASANYYTAFSHKCANVAGQRHLSVRGGAKKFFPTHKKSRAPAVTTLAALAHPVALVHRCRQCAVSNDLAPSEVLGPLW